MTVKPKPRHLKEHIICFEIDRSCKTGVPELPSGALPSVSPLDKRATKAVVTQRDSSAGIDATSALRKRRRKAPALASVRFNYVCSSRPSALQLENEPHYGGAAVQFRIVKSVIRAGSDGSVITALWRQIIRRGATRHRFSRTGPSPCRFRKLGRLVASPRCPTVAIGIR
ncbi:unnamed protein product, partial [Iphiclides podalirius]